MTENATRTEMLYFSDTGTERVADMSRERLLELVEELLTEQARARREHMKDLDIILCKPRG